MIKTSHSAFVAPNMANDSTEEPPSKVTSEDEEHIYEHIYETLVSSDKPELNRQMAMDELITTEANYVHNLQLCIFNIRDHLQKKQVRMREMVCNHQHLSYDNF